jgi:hypothetical protein
MSIASEEAEWYALHRYVGRTHIEYRDGRSEVVPDFPQKITYRREGYIAGRTAEVTDAEVKAAITEWDGHGYCCREGAPIVCMCGAKLKNRHEYDTHLLRAMLEEARKAVME